MLSFQEARDRLLAAARPVEGSRRLPLAATLGRVLAEPARAAVNVPPLDNSAMDGYALRIADLTAEGVCLPVSQRIAAGSVGVALEPGTVARIFTGAPVPAGADAVVMQERCTVSEHGVVVNQMPHVGENIRRAAEDMACGEIILPTGVRLRAQELALAASAGLPELTVCRRLRVALLLTGDELFEPGVPLPPGGIYNSNRYALKALIERMGCEVRDLGQVPDDLMATRAALKKAASDNDLIITSGGVSVGEEDHVKPAVEAEGRLDLWKIAIKPGKPLAFGEISGGERPAAFVGLPGNPVSGFVTFLMLVRPFILKLQGASQLLPRSYRLEAAFETRGDATRTEFLRVCIDADGRLQSYASQGSAAITSLCRSDGLAVIPAGEGVHRGDALLFIPFEEILG